MKWIKYILTAIVIVSLLVYLSLADYNLIREHIARIGSGFVLIVGLSAAAYFMGSIAWYLCFRRADQVSIWNLLYARTIGENITIFNPTNIIAGEASKFYLLSHTSLSTQEKADSIIMSRMVLISSQLTLALVCFIGLAGAYNCLLPFLIILACILLIARICTRRIIRALYAHPVTRRSRMMRHLAVWIHKGRKAIIRIVQYSKEHRHKVALALLASTIHWILGASEFLVILHYLDVPISLVYAVTIDMGVVIGKSIGGFIPGQIGVEEMSNKMMLSMIGIQGASLWLTVSIVRRAKQVFWVLVSILLFGLHQLTHTKEW